MSVARFSAVLRCAPLRVQMRNRYIRLYILSIFCQMWEFAKEKELSSFCEYLNSRKFYQLHALSAFLSSCELHVFFKTT